jgi:hypothetical protein
MVFLRGSRYFKLPDAVDDGRVGGRPIASKGLRPLPDVGGTFQHTVAEGDRLDHLATRYYQQPQRWWRICDANPDVLSPLDLVGRGPIRTVRIALDVARSGQPEWAGLAARLSAEPGIERFRFEDVVEIVPRATPGDDGPANLADERHRFAIVISYNRFVVGVARLIALVSSGGHTVRPTEEVGRIGKRIVVPPDVVG